jgi:type III pantothenate kinase
VLELILCDIGNTTFHFYINGKHQKYLLDEDIPLFDEKIYYISVNEKATSKLKHSNKNSIDLEPFIAFQTKYKGMGVDRKTVCHFVVDAVIIDAGSAITVDIMKNKKHEGGFILPGLDSIINTYPKISSKLDIEFNPKVNLDKIPFCTQDAISYGILKSIIEPIKKVIDKNQKLIFTGGDGKLLSQFFDNSIYKEDLIFENMKGIINANNCIA